LLEKKNETHVKEKIPDGKRGKKRVRGVKGRDDGDKEVDLWRQTEKGSKKDKHEEEGIPSWTSAWEKTANLPPMEVTKKRGA